MISSRRIAGKTFLYAFDNYDSLLEREDCFFEKREWDDRFVLVFLWDSWLLGCINLNNLACFLSMICWL